MAQFGSGLPDAAKAWQAPMVMQEDAVVSVPFEGKRPEHNSTSFDLKEKSSIEKDDYEKGDAYEKGGDEVMSIHEAQDTVIENDGSPFPVDPNMPVETHQITVRALLVGVALGFVVGASNVYLGLKTGFTFGASLFGSILGYAILKPLSRVLPEKLGGGYFGPKETVCIQSTASAAGGLSGLFVAAVPAMAQLGLIDPIGSMPSLIALSFFTAYFGFIFAMPLRKYYILRQKLRFPTPTATAYTIRSLHNATSVEARKATAKKIKILLGAFTFSLIWVVVTKYAPGVLFTWNFGWIFYQWGWTSAIVLLSWGWAFQFTPAFISVGMLTGMNPAFSWLAGSVLAYGIIGPSLVATGKAFSPVIDEASGYHNNFSMTTVNLPDGTTDPSRGTARYWLLWPGILMMLVASFTDLLIQAPMYYRQGKQLFNQARKTIGEKRGKDMSHITNAVPEASTDPAPPHEQVNNSTWIIGLTIAAVTSMVLAKTEFGVNPGMTLFALILGFVFAFVAATASGTTDVNPIGVVAKAGQLILGGVSAPQNLTLNAARLNNLVLGSVVGQSAAHAVDCLGDLKTGHLLGAAPNAQFWSQVVGSTAGFAFAPVLYYVFGKAYPCINDLSVEQCAFGLPAVSAWRAVAIAVTSPTLPVTLSSGMTAIGLSVAACLCHIARYKCKPSVAKWIPNWSAVGLAFVVPQNYYAIAVATGALIALFWQKKNPKSWESWGFALAAGCIAGEGIAGVVNAALTIGNVDGSFYGSTVGCPLGEYCG